MIQRIKSYLLQDRVDDKRVDVIPGIRVLAIGLIAWFHIWQQSWLSPYIITERRLYDFLALPRAGYLWVDMFILLSAFQLFLPHARSVVDGTRPPDTMNFYRKRAWRILPSYYLSVAITLGVAIINKEYYSPAFMVADLVSHLTFTQTFWTHTYIGTRINVVLWTVGILVQFYIVFPLLARLFRKHPIPTFIMMTAAGLAYRFLYVNLSADPAMTLNQLPSFFDVLALGMLTAYAYVLFCKRGRYQFFSPLFTLISIATLILIYMMMKQLSSIGDHSSIQRWQGSQRFYLGILFAIFLFASAYAMRWWRWIFANKVMVFLASLSYNYYIWHQYIAVKLRAWNFPPSLSEQPHMDGEKPWQYLFTACAFLIPLGFSFLLTWLYEGKLMGLLRKKAERHRRIP